MIGEDHFHKTRHRFQDTVSVARRDGRIKCEKLFVVTGTVIIAERSQDFRQIIDHKSVSMGKHLRPNDVNFPTGDVEMDAIEKCRIVIFSGQLIKQIGIFQHIWNTVLSIANKNHGRFCTQGLDTTGKRLIRHVIFHDVNEFFVRLLLFSCEFVKRNGIPIPDQSQLAVGIIDKQFRNSYFSAGEQNSVR